MDLNKENNFTEELDSDTAETVETEAQTTVLDAETSDEAFFEGDTEISAEVSEDDYTDVDPSTLIINADELDEELMRYGIFPEEDFSEEGYINLPKKRAIQKPIVIAALSFLLTAVLVFGGYFLYNFLSPKGIEGTWVQAGVEKPFVYLTFDDGEITMNVGGYQRYGYYEVEKVNGMDVIKTDFYELLIMGNNIVATFSENNKTMTLNFLYEGVDLSTFDTSVNDISLYATQKIELVRGKTPDLTIDPENITHASADELGVTTLNIDEKIIGTWRLDVEGAEGKYNTFTFNSDGTGSHEVDYIYYEMYGCGLGEKNQFKYTVNDGEILITTPYFDGTNTDQLIKYYIDKNNLVIDGIGFQKVK